MDPNPQKKNADPQPWYCYEIKLLNASLRFQSQILIILVLNRWKEFPELLYKCISHWWSVTLPVKKDTRHMRGFRSQHCHFEDISGGIFCLYRRCEPWRLLRPRCSPGSSSWPTFWVRPTRPRPGRTLPPAHSGISQYCRDLSIASPKEQTTQQQRQNCFSIKFQFVDFFCRVTWYRVITLEFLSQRHTSILWLHVQ